MGRFLLNRDNETLPHEFMNVDLKEKRNFFREQL